MTHVAEPRIAADLVSPDVHAGMDSTRARNWEFDCMQVQALRSHTGQQEIAMPEAAAFIAFRTISVRLSSRRSGLTAFMRARLT